MLNLPKRFQNKYNYFFGKEEYIDSLKRELERYPPCNHPGCYSHISHSCENCHRIQGDLPEKEKMIIREIIKSIEFPEKQYTKFTRFEIMDI